MMNLPAHKNLEHPPGQIKTLGDYVVKVEQQERQHPMPAPVDAKDVLRTLVIAIDNCDRAKRRLLHTDGLLDRGLAAANLTGACLRYEEAVAAARSLLSSTL